VSSLGIRTEYLVASGFDSLLHTLAERDESTTIALDVGSLSKVCKLNKLGHIAAMLRSREAVLLLVTEASEAANRFLQELTSGAVRGVQIQNGDTISFPEHSRELSRELSSHSYRKDPGAGLSLIIEGDPAVETVMKIGDQASFVRLRSHNGRMFVWSTPQIFDIQRPLAAESEFETAADQYVPVMIFLRHAFGAQCWHNPSPGAGIVIDDPLLRRKYGFIDFERLLKSARTHQYHITLAFIPWNHWRSKANDARIFLECPEYFSVCAHGCDHTNNELKSADYGELLGKSFVARSRMDRHSERIGIMTAPLMVCPQEQYSLEAMRAFSDSRQFLGLICTACMPRNLATPQLTGADLLLPAQDSFFGFPVFKRHYWKGDMATFAMSLFLGKPAILVEHHEFFRDGMAGVEGFAHAIAQMDRDLKWRSLLDTVTRTHARRRVGTRKWEVRFFTDLFHLEHERHESVKYRFMRRVPESKRIEAVRVNGRDVPFSRDGDFLTFDAQACHPQTVSIQVDIASVRPVFARLVRRMAYSPGLRHQGFVALRRGLCELRDNVISRSPVAFRLGKRLIKSIKQASR
jgi:hypothetical protein